VYGYLKKINKILDEHEGPLMFLCFLSTGLVGYFLAHGLPIFH